MSQSLGVICTASIIRHVRFVQVFGELVSGFSVLAGMESAGSPSGTPNADIVIEVRPNSASSNSSYALFLVMS